MLTSPSKSSLVDLSLKFVLFSFKESECFLDLYEKKFVPVIDDLGDCYVRGDLTKSTYPKSLGGL